ncbi:hypothetical protein ACFV94_08670 [Streptomyces sp. NPDC059896]|uniref:hypothetical protein n=1 Tax=Streptomyces sp. NPDC059896 TaxID=3346993 RepID=UPI0036526062
MDDFKVSVRVLLLAEARDVGLVPVTKPNVPASPGARLVQVDQEHLRAEIIGAASGMLVAAQARWTSSGPGTLRDSLFFLDALLGRDGGPSRRPWSPTPRASYSDIVFGLFAILGYHFSPRMTLKCVWRKPRPGGWFANCRLLSGPWARRRRTA